MHACAAVKTRAAAGARVHPRKFSALAHGLRELKAYECRKEGHQCKTRQSIKLKGDISAIVMQKADVELSWYRVASGKNDRGISSNLRDRAKGFV